VTKCFKRRSIIGRPGNHNSGHRIGQPEQCGLSEQPGEFGSLKCRLPKKSKVSVRQSRESFLLKNRNHFAPDEPSAQAPCTRTMFVFISFFSLLPYNVTSNWTFSIKKTTCRSSLFNHLRKQFAGPSGPQTLAGCPPAAHHLPVMSAARSAVVLWIPRESKKKTEGSLYSFVNL